LRKKYNFIAFSWPIPTSGGGWKPALVRHSGEDRKPALVRHSGEGRNPGEGTEEVDKEPAVYILAGKRDGTLYVAVTSDLRKKVREHKNDLVEGFMKSYPVHLLVWYELHETMESALGRRE